MTLAPLHPVGVLWSSPCAGALCPPPPPRWCSMTLTLSWCSMQTPTPALVFYGPHPPPVFYGPHPALLFQGASTLVCPARTVTQLERLWCKTLPALQSLSEHCSYFCLPEISKGWRVTAAPNSCQILRTGDPNGLTVGHGYHLLWQEADSSSC